MAFYNTCPLCNANLDPGEKCDCEKPAVSNNYTVDVEIISVKPGIVASSQKV